MVDTMDIQDTDTDTTGARSVRLTPPFLPLLMLHPLLFPILAMVLVLAMLMEHPFLPLPLLLLKNPQLLKPERNVKLTLKLIPKLGIMDTTDMDMVDTTD